MLDPQSEKLGTKTWNQVDRIEKQDADVIEEFGGSCRGRTYGPGIHDVRLRDLLLTVGLWLAGSGESLHLIGIVLNHRDVSTTARLDGTALGGLTEFLKQTRGSQ